MKALQIKAIRTEIYSRVVGYYRPVDSWNKGKQEEFKDRTSIDITKGEDGAREAGEADKA